MLVPADVWPDFVCDENGGAGWDATVLKVARQSALVSFDSARTDDGRRYEDEQIAISALRPHPTRARPPAAASAVAPAAPPSPPLAPFSPPSLLSSPRARASPPPL